MVIETEPGIERIDTDTDLVSLENVKPGNNADCRHWRLIVEREQPKVICRDCDQVWT